MTTGNQDDSTQPEGFLRLKVRYGDLRISAAGLADTVMEAYRLFREDAVREGIEPEPGKTFAPKSEKKGEEKPPDLLGTDQPLAVFVNKRNWPNQDLKGTAIVLWARDHDQKPSLRPSEIEKYWRGTSGKVPGNMSAVCGNAEKKGLLYDEGGGKYSVTGHGIDEVKKVPTQ